MVVVVQVLDQQTESIRRELARLTTGDICVAHGSATTARLIDAGSQLRPLAQDPRNGVQSLSGAGTDGLDGPITVTLTVVDEQLLSEFERIGLDLVQLHPAVHPVG